VTEEEVTEEEVAGKDVAEEEVKEQAHRGRPQGRAGTFGRGLSRPSRYLSPRDTPALAMLDPKPRGLYSLRSKSRAALCPQNPQKFLNLAP
jgi:hypothetical protein